MHGLTGWLFEQEERFRPYFLAHNGVREHVVGLLLLHAATCGDKFEGALHFFESIAGMYRIHGNTAFELPVDGWAKIRRAQQIGLVDRLHIDVVNSEYLPDPPDAIPDTVMATSIRGLLQAAPMVDSFDMSTALAEWCGKSGDIATMGFHIEEQSLPSLRLEIAQNDGGVSALQAFWAIEAAYTRLSSARQDEAKTRFTGQLSFADSSALPERIPSDLPNWIIANNLRVVEDSDENMYYAKVRLYAACIQWYSQKNRPPLPLDSVASAVSCIERANSASGV